MTYYELRKKIMIKAVSEYCKRYNKSITKLEDIYDCYDDNSRMTTIFISCSLIEMWKLSLFNIISIVKEEKECGNIDRRLLLDIYVERYLPTNKG